MSTPPSPKQLLVVDDDPGIARALKWAFTDYALLTAGDRETAVAQVERHRPAVVTLDLGLPPAVDDASEGLATLARILEIAPATKVIVVSGNDDRRHAVEAVAKGAADFYSKPIDAEILGLLVNRAFHLHALEEENRQLKEQSGGDFHGIVTASPEMRALCRMIEKVAPTAASVLITGESGTGKELAARALHALNRERRGPFVAINCAAIPEPLLESELFGHEKGAFTGAARQVKGKIEHAAEGTLFLDEIGDMPMELQAKLLRFLQERQIERLGGRQTIAVDVRVVSATHRDLSARVAQGRFREDLYYRLAQIPLRIPPLRERADDAVLIAKRLAERFAIEQKQRAPRFAPGALAAIRAHAWPGNVRELENQIQRAVILSENGEITAAGLGLDEAPQPAAAAPLSLRQARELAERHAVEAALAQADGNLTAAARILEISRPTLYSLVRQHDIDLPHATGQERPAPAG